MKLMMIPFAVLFCFTSFAQDSSSECVIKQSKTNTVEDMTENAATLRKAGYVATFERERLVERQTYKKEHSPEDDYLEIVSPILFKAGVKGVNWTNLSPFSAVSCLLEINPQDTNLRIIQKHLKIKKLSQHYVKITHRGNGFGWAESEGTEAILRIDLEQNQNNKSIRAMNCWYGDSETRRNLNPRLREPQIAGKLKLSSKKFFFHKENIFLAEKLCNRYVTKEE